MPLIAETYAEEVGLTTADLYSYQFALLPGATAAMSGFTRKPFGDRSLLHCPKLDVATLCDAEGREVGYCLGVAVDRNGKRVGQRWTLDANHGAEDFWQVVEEFAVDLAGRWLLILQSHAEARIYGDASGMYNCVYDPISGGIGSTLLMSLTRGIEESHEVDYSRTMSEGMRLPFGRTRDAHARRLGVNHYLRLNDFSETRFWPKSGDFTEAEPQNLPQVISEIRDRLAAVFAGIVTSTPSSVAVSGGADSRNLVAAGRASLDHVKRFFAWTHNFNSRTDYRSAVLMMQALGHSVERYAHTPEPWSEGEIAKRNDLYQRMTGFAVGPHQMYNVRLSSLPPAGEVVLTGNVMEALRAAHWKSGTEQRHNPHVFGLRRCLFVGANKFDKAFVDQWLPDYERWLAGLPPDARAKFVDVLFPEHNLPNLGTMYFSYQANFFLCPFNDRRLIQLCASLPVAYRYSHQANRDFLALAASELVDVPFATDIRRAKRRAS